jgi:hypothetical protein
MASKKRGRKPKDIIYNIDNNNNIIKQDLNIECEDLLLHIQVTKKDIEKYDSELLNELSFENNKNPTPYEEKKNCEEIERNIYNTTTSIIYLNNGKEILQIDGSKEKKKIVKRNIINVNYEIENEGIYPEKTNIYCFWDCHSFDGPPCYIPEKYINEKFYLYGNFCSFNCAAAYIFDKKDYNMFEKYSLLNFLYKKIYETEAIKIIPAPDKLCLKIFGGILSIDDFRNSSYQDKKYMIYYPPHISVLPKIDESFY